VPLHEAVGAALVFIRVKPHYPHSPLALVLGGNRGRDESRPYNSPLNALSRMEGGGASLSGHLVGPA
jgi:hypothetical protein